MNAPPSPFLRILGLGTLAAILIAIAAGPFFTGLLPVPARTLFWASLIGLNAFKWLAWYSWLGPRLPERMQPLLPLAGALLLNATLPWEVEFAYRAIGVAASVDPLAIYLVAVLISGLIAAIVWAASARTVPEAGGPEARQEEAGGALAGQPSTREVSRGLGARAPLERIAVATAEDHYVRLLLEGGGSRLELYRFQDAVADLSILDGLQVHRSAWVADRVVTGARREGRRWWLTTTLGVRLPVSDRHLPAVRARGWLTRRAASVGAGGGRR